MPGSAPSVNLAIRARSMAHYSADHRVVGFARESNPTELLVVYDIDSLRTRSPAISKP